MPPINELHFFDRLAEPEATLRKRQINLAQKSIKREESKGKRASQDYIRYLRDIVSFERPTLDWYKTAYSWPVADDVKRGDVTPAYLEIDERSVQFARDLLGPVRLILIVRRPADRLLSQLRMWATRPIRANMPEEETEWMDLFNEMTAKTNRGSYRRGVQLWRSHFGAENLLVLPYSEMKTDPRGMMDRIENHIGISNYKDYKLLNEQIHVTKRIAIPQSVIDAAAELTASEDEFILHEFGEDFFRRTR